MAKRYDPIMCMLVDEPTKAKDELKIVKEDDLWCVYKDGKRVGQSNSEAGAIRIYNRLESGKDSASALDKAIKTADGATGDKLYADVKAIYNLFSNILLTYTNEQSVQKLANEGTKKCLELAAKVKGVRDEAISTCDAASGDAMKQIANTAKAWAKQYNQLFEKATTAEEVKKLKSQKDNDYRRAMDNLDKIYNEVSQEYGRARNEVRDLFDEVDSNGFKAYQRVTQK